MRNLALLVLLVTLPYLMGLTIAVGPGGECGGWYGGCPSGQCCSRYGFCGRGPSYCSLTDEVSASEVVPNDQGRCGGKYGGCRSGLCCSRYGYCGRGPQYCKLGMCQAQCMPDMPNDPAQVQARVEAAMGLAQEEAYSQAIEAQALAQQAQAEPTKAGAP